MEYKVIHEKKEYNLNAVLSFDLLKEILYKLLISQDNIEKEIDNLKKSNIKRDADFSKLEKLVKENNIFDNDLSEGLNNSYYSQNENEEEENEVEEEEKEEEEKEKEDNEQIKDEIRQEKKEEPIVVKEEKKDEIKITKPKEQIIKTEAIQFNGENKDTEIKENKTENAPEIKVEEKKEEVNEINTNEENKENKEKETPEEKKEEIIVENQNIEENKIENKNEPIVLKQEENINANIKTDININNNNIDNTPTEQIKTESKKPKIKNKKKGNKIKKHKEHIQKEPEEKEQIIQNQNNYINNEQQQNTIQSKSNTNQIPPELISKMAKQIKDNKRQILDLEKKLKKDITLKTDDIKKECKYLINSHNKDNESKFSDLIDKVKEMMNLKEKLENQMEDCVTKCSSIDIINMFKDSGDGTVDAAKVMVRALEEKVFKKIEFIDTRAKKDQSDNSDIKNNMKDLYDTIKTLKTEIININESLDKNKNNMNNMQNDFDDYKNNVDEFMQNNSGLKKEIEKIKNHENNMKNKINEMLEKIKNLKNSTPEQGSNELFKLDFGNKGVDEEIIQTLEKKTGDLRKKMNDLENTLKLKIGDLEEIQYESKNLKTILDKKIAKEDLKELYNLHLNDLDEINDIKDNISATFDDIRKIKEAQTNIFQKLENLTRNISLLQNVQKNGAITPGVINFDKYVEQQKLTETIKPILTAIDKMNKEIASLDRNLSETDSYAKTLVKPERVNKLEDDLNAKISELKVIFSKKFVEKSEMTKNIKQLELQIKSLDFENKKADAETWLMAKQPIGCFNCASCEANIKNVNPSNEYLPWNKYPHQDKIYRMGKGFSHMLQMMTSEFVKSIGNAQKDSENEFTPRNNIKSPNIINNINNHSHSTRNDNNINLNINDRKQSASVLKINNKEQFNDEMLKKINNYNLYSSKGKGRMQLPRVFNFKKKLKLRNSSGVPISDDEGTRRNDSIEKENTHDHDITSPKIMKILKKKNYVRTEENADLTDTYNSKF